MKSLVYLLVTACALSLGVPADSADAPAQIAGTGTVNSVDAATHKMNMTHKPIPELGWPTMKMHFTVAPAVDLSTIQPGTAVEFSLGKNQKGAYEIQAIKPVASK